MSQRADASAAEGLIPLTVFGPRDSGNFEYAWHKGAFEAHCITDVGRKRKNNEDAFILAAPEDTGLARSRGLLFAVADGMGGASAGEFASRTALRQLGKTYFNGASGEAPVVLRTAVERANAKVHEESEKNPAYAGMGTTVSALAVHGPWAYIAQVGDSRVYLIREGHGIQQLTHDHSLVAEQLRCGMITEDEAKNHSLRNLITRAVGIKDSVSVDLFAIRLRKNDTIVVCSDGLSNMVSDHEIADAYAIGNLKLATRRLVGRALDEGGTDNITIVALRVNESPEDAPMEPGAEVIEVQPPTLLRKITRLFR